MLVLSRKVGDTLVIDNHTTITVTKISGNRVTLGIKAPNDVRILRGELQEFEVVPAGANEMDQPVVAEAATHYSI